MKTAIASKRNWREQLMVFLRNYRATPHRTTGKAPAELMFPNRNFKTKVPTMKPVTPYHHDKEVREQDQPKKQIMKRYANSKRYVKDHDVEIGDVVLVPQRKINKFTTPYRNMKYKVTKINGSMVTSLNEFGQNITRDTSKMKKIKEYSEGELYSEDEKESEGVCQSRIDQVEEECQPLRRSSRVRKATTDTKYRDYIT